MFLCPTKETSNTVCVEKGCGGKIRKNTSVRLETVVSGSPVQEIDDRVSKLPAYYCLKCGRLHWKAGDGIFTTKGNKRTFILNGEIIHRK
jgi:hypothetical protein